MTTLQNAPCFGQTSETIEDWLRANAKPGVKVVIRHTQGHMLRYEVAIVTGLGKGRIYTDKGSFYYSGKLCYHPKGQTRLVQPTQSTLAACDQVSCPGQAYQYQMTV